MPKTNTAANATSADLLESLMAGVQVATKQLETGKSDSQSLDQMLSGMETDLQAAQQQTGPADQTVETRRRILEANFETLQKNVAKENQDLAEAMGNLNILLETLGLEYADFKKPTVDEEASIKRAEQELEQAKLDRKKADNAWLKARAIKKADEALQSAQIRLEETKKRVQQAMRQRLMKASIEESVNTFKLACARISQIISNRIQDIKQQIVLVKQRRQTSYDVQQKAAEAREKLDEQINTFTGQLKEAEELLGTMEHGSSQYVAQDKKVKDLRSQIETLTGARNAALALYQDQQIFGERLSQHETVQTKLLANHNTWLTMLKSQMENRAVTLRSMLEALKAASDQDAAKQINDMGRNLDARGDVLMAELDAATQKAMVETFEGFPGFLRKLTETLSAQADVDIEVRQRFAGVLDEVKKHYGIDLRETSFFAQDSGQNAA